MLVIVNLYMSFFASLKSLLAPLLLLGIRLHLAWIFFSSGLVKISYWDGTLWLFSATSFSEAVENGNYYVPLLPSDLAAYAGAGAELFFPVLLALGLVGNFAALSLFAVNAVAVISFPQLWYSAGMTFSTFWSKFIDGSLSPGFYDHVVWAIALLVLMLYGAGKISVDTYLCAKMQRNKG